MLKIDMTRPKVTIPCKSYQEIRTALEELAAMKTLKVTPYIEAILVEHVRKEYRRGVKAEAKR